MHCVAGLDALTSGQVYIGDVDLGTLTDKELTMLRRERVGFVFQAYNLVPTLTAHENITLPDGRSPDAKPDQEWLDTRRSARSASRDRLKHRPSELSGGQQQRVAVARALASRPADHLRRRADRQPRLAQRAPRSSTFMRRAVDELDQTIVMVTHDPVAAELRRHASLFLADGRIVDEMAEPTRRAGARPAEGSSGD